MLGGQPLFAVIGETREAKLTAYRQARDQIRDRMIARFGPPSEEE